jgi:ABC-type multidrug transport system ATPase subunit
MQIDVTQAGKRFNRDWIFKNLTYSFLPAQTYAITGPNGSGKSTLLQVLAGAVNASVGKVDYQVDGAVLSAESVYNAIAIVAPYLEVVEEMTALEFLDFHAQFKPFLPGLNSKEIIHIIGLTAAAQKQIRYYSSGMKQRIKLAQAIFSNVPALFLDEPCTNLDSAGYALYHQLIQQYGLGRLIVVSSNDDNEMDFCQHHLNIMDWK